MTRHTVTHPKVRSFRIHVSEAALVDLHWRIATTR
jgi:hypothetical protein